MATLQAERECYAAMFGEDSMIQAEPVEITLDDFDEAIFLYQDMLEKTLRYHPTDTDEIAFLNKHIQECKVQKREFLKSLKSERRYSAA